MAITGDVFLFFLGLLALVLMGMSKQNILFAFASSMLWFALFLWLFFDWGTPPPLDLEASWAQIISVVFIILSIVPWLIRMDTEIKHEAEGQSWKSFGKTPDIKSMSRQDAYRKQLRRRGRR